MQFPSKIASETLALLFDTPAPAVDASSNKGVIYVIILTVAFMACLCVASVCWMSYTGKEPSQGLTLLTGGLVGSLTSMLVKTSPTQATTQVAVQDQPTVVPAEKSNVTVPVATLGETS